MLLTNENLTKRQRAKRLRYEALAAGWVRVDDRLLRFAGFPAEPAPGDYRAAAYVYLLICRDVIRIETPEGEEVAILKQYGRFPTPQAAAQVLALLR